MMKLFSNTFGMSYKRRLRLFLNQCFVHGGFYIDRWRWQDHFDATLGRAMDRKSIKTIIDVGANTGQFVQNLLVVGRKESVVSFEPILDEYNKLKSNVQKSSFPDWSAFNLALAASDGESIINISENKESSSIRPMMDRHKISAPASQYVQEEKIKTRRLDGFVKENPDLFHGPYLLKCDTQGYEDEVLLGAEGVLKDIDLILIEVSWVPLYRGAPAAIDLISNLQNKGYEMLQMSPSFTDAQSGQWLQTDILFQRVLADSPSAPAQN